MASRRKVLVVGSGGREHALAIRLLESSSVEEVVVTPGNGGTAALPHRFGQKVLRNASGTPLDVAIRERPDLVVVGPEAPLVEGLADQLVHAGFTAFGPGAAAARLEGSKAFMKDFALRHGIPTAAHRVVRSAAELDEAFSAFSGVPVVKADGLCAGKGVVVAESVEEARAAALAMLSGEAFGAAGKTVVLEERLLGAEASVHALSDGERFQILPAAQDYKRIGDADTGPNTGGMGTYAPAPLINSALTETIRRQIFEPAISGLSKEGCPFRGVLFAGLMLSPDGIPKLLEFNVRFGDPETQVLLAVLDGDLADALSQAAQGRLEDGVLSVSSRRAVCVVLAAAGYPTEPRTGEPIEGVSNAEAIENVRVFHAGTRRSGDNLLTAGGRVLGVTATGSSLEQARAAAYRGVDQIHFSGAQFRRDIAERVANASP